MIIVFININWWSDPAWKPDNWRHLQCEGRRSQWEYLQPCNGLSGDYDDDGEFLTGLEKLLLKLQKSQKKVEKENEIEI